MDMFNTHTCICVYVYIDFIFISINRLWCSLIYLHITFTDILYILIFEYYIYMFFGY